MNRFLDPKLVRYSELNKVNGPALFISLADRTDQMFVSGGENPTVVFIGGRYAGESFRKLNAENWQGLAIEGVRAEVDVESAYSPDSESKELLTFARRDNLAGPFARQKVDQGFHQTFAADFEGVSESSSSGWLGFRQWRIVIGEGPEKTILWEQSHEKLGEQ